MNDVDHCIFKVKTMFSSWSSYETNVYLQLQNHHLKGDAIKVIDVDTKTEQNRVYWSFRKSDGNLIAFDFVPKKTTFTEHVGIDTHAKRSLWGAIYPWQELKVEDQLYSHGSYQSFTLTKYKKWLFTWPIDWVVVF
jgi:hypothetical protein